MNRTRAKSTSSLHIEHVPVIGVSLNVAFTKVSRKVKRCKGANQTGISHAVMMKCQIPSVFSLSQTCLFVQISFKNYIKESGDGVPFFS